MRYIVFDIESISKSGFNVAGKVDVNDQELTVIALYDSATDAYSSYTREELPKLWPILEHADLLIGFNSDNFDIPLLNRYYPGDLTRMRSLDLLAEVYQALGRRIRLQSLAEATLKASKSGNGLQAGVWWQEGKVDLVKKYCIQDVKLTKDLLDYALKHQKLKYKDLREIREMKLDTSHWLTERDAPSMTHTLQL